MSTLDKVMIGINSIACLAVLWSVICATNNMSRRTSLPMRFAFILLGIGALASLLSPVYLNRPPTAAEAALCMGVAVLSAFDRRRARQKRLASNHR